MHCRKPCIAISMHDRYSLSRTNFEGSLHCRLYSSSTSLFGSIKLKIHIVLTYTLEDREHRTGHNESRTWAMLLKIFRGHLACSWIVDWEFHECNGHLAKHEQNINCEGGMDYLWGWRDRLCSRLGAPWRRQLAWPPTCARQAASQTCPLPPAHSKGISRELDPKRYTSICSVLRRYPQEMYLIAARDAIVPQSCQPGPPAGCLL